VRTGATVASTSRARSLLLLCLGGAVVLTVATGSASAAARPPAARRTAAPAGRPDAALYQEAKRAEARLLGSKALKARRVEWDKVVARYRKLVARYPRSGYADNALLAIGDLCRAMAARFRAPRSLDDAVEAYRMLVAEYPSSSLGEQALFESFEIAQESGDRKRISEAGRAYLDAFPDARRAAAVKTVLKRRVPEGPLPSPPPPGLAPVFDLRFWSGDEYTRVVIDLQRKVEIAYDRLTNPDRLFVDLQGTRLHPNLTSRTFPVGDGLLAQVRIGQNKADVVRVVLDFKEVYEHKVFYIEEDDRARLVIDVRGLASSSRADGKKIARAAPPPERAAPESVPSPAVPEDGLPPPLPSKGSPAGVAATPTAGTAPGPAASPLDTLPSHRLDAMLTPEGAPSSGAARRPAAVVVEGTRSAEGAPAPGTSAVADARPGPPSLPATPQANRDGTFSLARQLGLGARRIVIDPGHGGHDPGTIGRGGLMEKDLVLDVALRLGKMVREGLSADVVMTRSTDVFIPLEERTAIANSRAADLFLSVHANASRNPTARGIETYFLSFAQNPHAEAVAARENAISSATLKDLQGLVKAITLNSKIDESRDFATSVQEAMVQHLRGHGPAEDRGVHTAPFYVLIGANMPSVLAEIAFVSNPDDERRLKTPAFREEIARSLFKGVRAYLEALNRTEPRRLTVAPPRTRVTERGREARRR
jgi:N-acetylmuramoyl-L-alanine amidase